MVRVVSLRFWRHHFPMKLDSTLKSESATGTPFGSLKEPFRKMPARIQTTLLSLSFRRQRKSVRKSKKASKKVSNPKFRMYRIDATYLRLLFLYLHYPNGLRASLVRLWKTRKATSTLQVGVRVYD